MSACLGSLANLHIPPGSSGNQVGVWLRAIPSLAAVCASGYIKLTVDSGFHQMDLLSLWRGVWVKDTLLYMVPIVFFVGADVLLRLITLFCAQWPFDSDSEFALQLCPFPSLFSLD